MRYLELHQSRLLSHVAMATAVTPSQRSRPSYTLQWPTVRGQGEQRRQLEPSSWNQLLRPQLLSPPQRPPHQSLRKVFPSVLSRHPSLSRLSSLHALRYRALLACPALPHRTPHPRQRIWLAGASHRHSCCGRCPHLGRSRTGLRPMPALIPRQPPYPTTHL